jgi:hypothetical protein
MMDMETIWLENLKEYVVHRAKCNLYELIKAGRDKVTQHPNKKCREFLENYLWEEAKEASKYLIPSSYLFYLIEDIIHVVQYLQEKNK